MRSVPWLLLLFSLVAAASGAPHPAHQGFSQVHDVSLADGSLRVSDTAVYHQGWYSVDGSAWVSFSLSGNHLPHRSGWLTGVVSASLPAFGAGEHYVIVYSCSLVERAWDCHGGRWQLLVVDNDAVGDCFDGVQNQDETGVDCGGPCPLCLADWPAGLVAWWPLDGDALDVVGDNHGVPSSSLATSSAGCALGRCFVFDGDDDVVTLARSVTLSDGTYAFWITPHPFDDDRLVLGRWRSYSRIFLTLNGNVRLETDLNQEEFQFVSRLPDDLPVHVVLSRSGDVVDLYIDGSLHSSETVVGASPLTFNQIGMDTRSFRGLIDEVMVWDRSLSASEVSFVYDSSRGAYSSPSCADGVMNQDEEGVDCGGSCQPCQCVPNSNSCGPDGCGGDHPPCAAGTCVDGVCVSDGEGPVVVFYNGFEQHDVGAYVNRMDDWSSCGTPEQERILQDIDDTANPSKVYRHLFREGSVSLTKEYGFRCWYYLPEGRDELYFSYRLKFMDGFMVSGTPNKYGGKLPRVRGINTAEGGMAGTCPDGSDFFTPGVRFRDYGFPGPAFYIYHMDMWNVPHYLDQYYASDYYERTGIEPTSCEDFYDAGLSVYGQTFVWDLSPMPSGHWYDVTERVVVNTPGKADGIAEAFVDGRLVSQVTGLRFRDVPELQVNTIEFTMFFGGSGDEWASPQDQYAYFDDLVAYYYPLGSGVPVGNVPWDPSVPLPSVPLPAGPVLP